MLQDQVVLLVDLQQDGLVVTGRRSLLEHLLQLRHQTRLSPHQTEQVPVDRDGLDQVLVLLLLVRLLQLLQNRRLVH